MDPLNVIRSKIRSQHRSDENLILQSLINQCEISPDGHARTEARAINLVNEIRQGGNPGIMESLLAEYGLSTDEGVALMCLAEALLRVPDTKTIDDLIEDKIAPSTWGKHLGSSSSSLVNASTWALMLSGNVLQNSEKTGIPEVLHGVVKRLGEPVIRIAVTQAMKIMGHQFVLGRTIQEAVDRGKAEAAKGYTFSYDMLGEAALTATDAETFFQSYQDAINALAAHSHFKETHKNPGISVKLSALHPRYEHNQRDRVIKELVPRVKELALLAKNARMGFNIDAEEADRLEISLDVIELVLRSPELADWDGFGVVVQAFTKRAAGVIDWLYTLSTKLDRKIMVRLVKGAYWDTEIKQAQIDGVAGFPVYTQKSATDVSYICCAKKLLDYAHRIYPQFATHNAHTVAAILEMAGGSTAFEFQRLHGMGESLHDNVLKRAKTRCRIYAPVGAHRDLLAYLVRRLLENGANSSFVNQIVDVSVPPERVAADPFKKFADVKFRTTSKLHQPSDLYLPDRVNSKGLDLRNDEDLATYETARKPFSQKQWNVKPLIAGPSWPQNPDPVFNPADPEDCIGYVANATKEQVETALASACNWGSCLPTSRANILEKIADLYEENAGELWAALTREAGKTPFDAVSEIREAVDFLRYYAVHIKTSNEFEPRGIISCISPWNFPLAIFTGQIAAALAAGNGVLAKPADPTAIVASIAIQLMHEAGVPKNVLQFLPGQGSIVGTLITSDQRIHGVCFTGSTAVAQKINQVMSKHVEPDAMFIAETGGLNAMLVDSTALPEQAIRDIVVSAFQSAGQRCSALRLLYIQKDVAEEFLAMLYGAMDELSLGSPWDIANDIGPAISASAKQEIDAHIALAKSQNRLLKQLKTPETGHFVAPSVIQVGGISELEKETFGPVLHIATFEAGEIDQIVEDINQSGYGLTFGLHTRIDDRVEQITSKLNVGNIYVNRNQIGAVVGSQPFGGEGLSGTGPKAGGPSYIDRFTRKKLPKHHVATGKSITLDQVQLAIDQLPNIVRSALFSENLPGPTGESNRLIAFPRGVVLCLGPTAADAIQQQSIAEEMGCVALAIAPGVSGSRALSGCLERKALAKLNGFDAVALWSDVRDLSEARKALADRDGQIIPLISTDEMRPFCLLERHICIDTTAAGGNASLLADNDEAV